MRRRAGAESFAEAWDAALDQGRGALYDEAVRRGIEGYFVPTTRLGRVTGYRHRMDNRLLFAACYGERPPRLDRIDGDES